MLSLVYVVIVISMFCDTVSCYGAYIYLVLSVRLCHYRNHMYRIWWGLLYFISMKENTFGLF